MIYINGYNENYRIAIYNLPNKYTKMLKKYFSDYNEYAENTFKIIEVSDLMFDKKIINYPDILLVNINEKIPEHILEYADNNLIKIIRFVDSFPEFLNEKDKLFSFSLRGYKTKNDKKRITEFDYSIELLKSSALDINFSKLKYISNKLLKYKVPKFVDSKKESLNILMRLHSFIELKDPYTKIHCDNVCRYAALLAKELELSEEEIEIIKIGAKLHDIGKVGIPDSILMKKTFLNKQEFEIMKKHTVIGEAIIPNEDNYILIKQMIRSHHERLDGNGYPDGLKDRKIPYFVKILSVVDAFDAMTSKRSYNNPKTLEEAFMELRRAAYPKFNEKKVLEQQFDPILVESFIEAFSKNQELMNEFAEKDLEIIDLRSKKKRLK